MLHKCGLDQQDMLDGVRWRLEDPRCCKFDPKTIECKGANAPTRLTALQVEAVRAPMPDPNPGTGEQVFPPPYPGSELHRYRFTDSQPFDWLRIFVSSYSGIRKWMRNPSRELR